MGNAGNEVFLTVSEIIRLPSGWDFLVCFGDRCLIIFLTYVIKKYYLSFDICSIFDSIHRITSFPERYTVFYNSNVTYEI